eukprot:scpid79473/ scgid26101/ 
MPAPEQQPADSGPRRPNRWLTEAAKAKRPLALASRLTNTKSHENVTRCTTVDSTTACYHMQVTRIVVTGTANHELDCIMRRTALLHLAALRQTFTFTFSAVPSHNVIRRSWTSHADSESEHFDLVRKLLRCTSSWIMEATVQLQAWTSQVERFANVAATHPHAAFPS